MSRLRDLVDETARTVARMRVGVLERALQTIARALRAQPEQLAHRCSVEHHAAQFPRPGEGEEVSTVLLDGAPIARVTYRTTELRHSASTDWLVPDLGAVELDDALDCASGRERDRLLVAALAAKSISELDADHGAQAPP